MKTITLTTAVTRIAEAGNNPIEIQNQGSVTVRTQFDGGTGTGLSDTKGRAIYPRTAISFPREDFPHAIYARTESGEAVIHVEGAGNE